MSTDRFVDDGRWIRSFMDEVLVHCPQCNGCAAVTRSPDRIVCPECGYAKDGVRWDLPGGPDYGDGSLSLWLQTACCGHVLWAFNREHLAWLESYVSARHRERQDQDLDRKPEVPSWSNSNLASRLPRWMTAAKNREPVMHSLEKLKARLAVTVPKARP